MFEEVRIRERKSAKHGKTYEYRFEVAPVGGERKWISKGGFLTEEEARQAGIEAWKRYCLCGLSERPSDIILMPQIATTKTVMKLTSISLPYELE